MQEQPIKLIATDLDGTLLNMQHVITPRTERALKAAMARGIQVVFATGKTITSRTGPVAQLGLSTPGVYSQGLVLLNGDGTILYRRDLAPDAVRAAAAFAEAHDYNIVAVADGGTRVLTQRLSTLTTFMTDHHEPEPELVGPISAIASQAPITKLLIEIDPAALPAAREALAGQLNGSADLVRSMPQLLEVLPKDASKGDGLRRLLEHMGVDPQHVIAFGDAENDVEMLELAGFSVAMGNACSRIREIADYITTSNDDDGVGRAVEKFVLGQPG